MVNGHNWRLCLWFFMMFMFWPRCDVPYIRWMIKSRKLTGNWCVTPMRSICVQKHLICEHFVCPLCARHNSRSYDHDENGLIVAMRSNYSRYLRTSCVSVCLFFSSLYFVRRYHACPLLFSNVYYDDSTIHGYIIIIPSIHRTFNIMSSFYLKQ